MKKIGIDTRMIEHSGIGVRILNLVQSLAKEKRDGLEIYLFGNKEILSKYELDKSFPIIEYNVKVYSIREFWGHSKMKEMDILDIPHFNIPIRYLKKCIVTIHDIIPYKMKEFFPSKENFTPFSSLHLIMKETKVRFCFKPLVLWDRRR